MMGFRVSDPLGACGMCSRSWPKHSAHFGLHAARASRATTWMEFTKLVATKANTASQHRDVAAMCKPSVRAFCSRSQGVKVSQEGTTKSWL